MEQGIVECVGASPESWYEVTSKAEKAKKGIQKFFIIIHLHGNTQRKITSIVLYAS